MQDTDIRAATAEGATYSVTARRFHWWTVAFVVTKFRSAFT